MPQGSGKPHAGIGQDRLHDAHMPQNITFGVECELYCNSDAKSQELRQELAIALPGRGWQVGRDTSIYASKPDQTTAEVRSGILCGREGCDQVFTALKTLKRFNIAVNKSCGLHIHVGCLGRRWTLDECKQLLCNVVWLEPALDMLMPPSRRQNTTYCKSVRDTLGGSDAALRHISACTTLEQLRDTVNPGTVRGNPDKYYTLNLRPLFDPKTAPGTVEFRQPAGSQNPAKVMGFIVLTVKLVEYSCLLRKGVVIYPDPFDSLLEFFSDVEALQHFLPRRKDQIQKNIQQHMAAGWI